jgi:hypothetical protein
MTFTPPGEPGNIPAQMRATVLSGTGIDQLAVRSIPVPRPGPQAGPYRRGGQSGHCAAVEIVTRPNPTGRRHRLVVAALTTLRPDGGPPGYTPPVPGP